MPPASQVSCHFFSISAGVYFVRVIMAASSPFWGIHLKKSCLLIHQKKNPSFHYRDEGLASRYHPHWQRSASSADTQQKDGGPEGTRTPDLLNAIETRSQLRHRPIRDTAFLAARRHPFHRAAPRSSACYRRLPGVATQFTSAAPRRVRS